MRDHIDRLIWIWDPAAPTAVTPDPNADVYNLACGGHSWDAAGDLIWSGGDRNDVVSCSGYIPIDCNPPQAGVPEPKWGFVFFRNSTTQGSWLQTPDMLLPPAPLSPRHGYYYPTTVAMHDGSVVSVCGSGAPWREGNPALPCCLEPLMPPAALADSWQRFEKSALTWRGRNLGGAGDVPYAGLPNGTAVGELRFGQYPGLFLLSNGHLFATHVTDAGLDLTHTPNQRRYSCSAWSTASG